MQSELQSTISRNSGKVNTKECYNTVATQYLPGETIKSTDIKGFDI